MELKEAQQILSGVPQEKVAKLFPLVSTALGSPETVKYKEENTGRYNAIALPEIPADIKSVKDASKSKLYPYRILGQQVIFPRNLKPPVIVEYITETEARKYRAKLIEELRRRSK